MRMHRTLLLVALAWSSLAATQTPKLKAGKKEHAPKLDLTLPAFGELPKDQKLERPTEKPAEERRSQRPDEGYTVVRVVHGKGFLRGPDGAKPSAPFTQVTLAGTPLATEKFSTVVRVKSPAKKAARIELAVLDVRGDTVMEASGELVFRGTDEAEWQVDWDPTGVRGPGEHQVLVRVGGNPLGTFPLKFVTAN